MRIAARVDASSQIGTGHFMRCLTLADGLLRRGAKIRFVSRGLPAHLRDMLAQRSIELASLDSGTEGATAGDLHHSHWLGCSQEQDAQVTQQALSDRQWDWLIVDHYALDARWESKLRGSARRIMVVDDIADRQHDCDLLLDQNFYADMQTRYIGKVPSHCELLMGPRYALLRDEFRKVREQVKPRMGPVKRILVFFGGVDADNYTGRAIEALSKIDISELHVEVVIGAQHPCREQIQQACTMQGYVCHVQTTRMAELMAEADLAIGAAGAASWERCCLGLPCVVGAVAQNQVQAAEDLSVVGAVTYVGAMHEITVEKLNQRIVQACAQDWLNKASLLGLGLVDSEGVMRVINILGKVMTGNKVLEHWNQRATLEERAGSNDLVAKELEIRAISKHIKNGMVVAEFGCGNGTTAIELLRQHDIELHCFDFSPAMIESAKNLAKEAGMENRIHFQVGDVRDEPKQNKKFDVIYSERMIINLPDWESQAKAIQYLTSNLNAGGRYLMCENSKPGLDHLNKLRTSVGLEIISQPWHNVYLIDDLVASLDIREVKLVDVEPFSSTYYFLSRVVNAWLANKEGKQPSYDAPVNQLALGLPPFGDCSQGKLWVFEKTKA